MGELAGGRMDGEDREISILIDTGRGRGANLPGETPVPYIYINTLTQTISTFHRCYIWYE